MSIVRTAIVTILHFVTAVILLTSQVSYALDPAFIQNYDLMHQIALWLIFLIYSLLTFPLCLLFYTSPGIFEILALYPEPDLLLLLLQAGVSYIQVRALGSMRISLGPGGPEQGLQPGQNSNQDNP